MDRAIIRLIRKAGAKSKLRSFLDVNEPQLVKFLQTLWQNQGRAITYKELREAILSGEFSVDGVVNGHYAEKWLNEWRQDYSRFVQEHMLPTWEKAMETSARELPDSFPERLSEWRFNPADTGVRSWMRTHGAAFVTNSTQTQLDGLRAVLRHAGASGMSVDELARVVRPMVGLTVQQTEANLKYYNTLVDGGMKEKKALEKSILYGQRQHRYRGYNIARTELAFAYNRGALEGIRQAQRQGLIGAVIKRWVTADDERTCNTCGNLDGHKIALDEDFNFYTRLMEPGIHLVPPAHPSCRCAVAFEEAAPGELGFTPPVPEASPIDVITEFTTNEVRITPSEKERTESLTTNSKAPIIYTETDLYNFALDYNRSRANNMISAFTPFEDYVKYKRLIDSEIVGLTTADGIEIKGQTKHFIERVFGTTQDPKTGRPRSGVDIDVIIDALKNPVKIVPHGDSIQYRSAQCFVSINPQTGMLIQTNPNTRRFSDA